jgi:hypothetical protein
MSNYTITNGTGSITLDGIGGVAIGNTTQLGYTGIGGITVGGTTNAYGSIIIGKTQYDTKSYRECMPPNMRTGKLAIYHLTHLHKDVCGLITQMLQPSARYMLMRVFKVTPIMTQSIRMCMLRWDRPEMYACACVTFDRDECRLADAVNVPNIGYVGISGPRSMRKYMMHSFESTQLLERAIELGLDDVFECLYQGAVPPVQSWKLSDAITMRLLEKGTLAAHNRMHIIANGGEVGVYACLQFEYEGRINETIKAASRHLETLIAANSRWPEHVLRLHCEGRLWENANVPILEWAHTHICQVWKPVVAKLQPHDAFVWLCDHGSANAIYGLPLQNRLYLHINNIQQYKPTTVESDADAALYPMILQAFGDSACEVNDTAFRVWLYICNDIATPLYNIIAVDSCVALRKYLQSHAVTSADIITMISMEAVRCLRECRPIIASMRPCVTSIINDQLNIHPNPCIRDVWCSANTLHI